MTYKVELCYTEIHIKQITQCEHRAELSNVKC
jgi:hypothetical protein